MFSTCFTENTILYVVKQNKLKVCLLFGYEWNILLKVRSV